MLYRIDASDAVVFADGAFHRFAAVTGDWSPPEPVLGDPLCRFIADPELCALHLALVGRARAGRTITIRSRGDSPTLRHSVEITFTPRENGDVELCCWLADSAAPSPSRPAGDDQMLRLCAWCYRAERDGWRDIEEVVTAEQLLERPQVPTVTHGICDDCMASVASELLESAA